MSYEYRVVWKREGQRRRTEIRQTLDGARRKADYLRGEFSTGRDNGYGSITEVPGIDWLTDLGVPPLEFVHIEGREVGDWFVEETLNVEI